MKPRHLKLCSSVVVVVDGGVSLRDVAKFITVARGRVANSSFRDFFWQPSGVAAVLPLNTKTRAGIEMLIPALPETVSIRWHGRLSPRVRPANPSDR